MTIFSEMGQAWRRHWPHYLAEAAGIGFFMLCGSLLTILFEHPESPVHQALAGHDLLRRALIGLGMGLVIVVLVYNPWGKKSGAHINPAVTIAFWQMGKIRRADAAWYMLAQLAGALLMGQLLKLALGAAFAHPAVNYLVTEPKEHGQLVAFGAEFVISFILMVVMLLALHHERLRKSTGWLIGILLVLYITFESPLSSMSLNPARTLGSAVAAQRYTGLWLYWVAPIGAMLLATVFFNKVYKGQELACAILAGCDAAPDSPHATTPHATEPPVYPQAVAE
ncbi:MIP/aquaporin family protein [Hymenobacter metallicola]|uniref:Aquaporin family protein n=1 Tax=Hymenobacter metallicola TaxID=2563114 RepID=A0A4Z0QD29_9BACT|nr:aquaporin [Hymenobacter metallicola]TGE27594.1 aquaporin family protein [Hymenobacter metallicola]